MNNRIKNIKVNLTSDELKNQQFSDSEDSALFDTIGDYMTGCFDLEDIKNDPALAATKEIAREMISNHNKNLSVNSENEKFIREIFSGNESEDSITNEIRTIKQEITDKNLNLETSEWVSEWQEKKQQVSGPDQKSQEIRNFITGAINLSDAQPHETINDDHKKRSERTHFARYVSLSAAAIIGFFLLIKTLLPTSDPDKLFNSFYKPFEAISPVTRSINSEPDRYSSAITSYKNGNYKGAITGFESVLERDPSSESARFLLGISQLALQNYNQTIDLLTTVADGYGEYGKEARWYLGLSYLKTGNRTQAINCFEYLIKANGFYRERSENILRRLK